MRKREDVIQRKAYYGFARNYPGHLGSSRYVIGESRAVRKREILRRILIGVLLLLLFAASFLVVSVGLDLSDRPLPEETTVQAETTLPAGEQT